MNKIDTYSFSEILFGLRSEYQKNQKLLDELAKYVEVDYKNMDRFTLTGDSGIYSKGIIRLDVYKKQSRLMNFINYIAFEYLNKSVGETYTIAKRKEGETDYSFDVDNYRIITPAAPNYKVQITDHKAFNELADEIYHTTIMQLGEISEKLNPFQRLDITPGTVALNGNLNCLDRNDFPGVSYEPTNDTIISYPYCKTGNFLTKEFLDTRIPKDCLPQELRDIIDQNIKQYNSLKTNIGIICDQSIKERTELSINERDGKIYLQRSRIIKPW